MRWCAFLAGDHPELPFAELASVVGEFCSDAELVERDGRFVRFSSTAVPWERLAMTRYVIQEGWRGSVGGAGDVDMDVEGSYAVRCIVVEGDVDAGQVEAEVGAAISMEDNEVDLDEPGTVVRVFVVGEGMVVGRQVFAYDAGPYLSRKNQNRPFSSPVSLHPRLARVLVNLAGVAAGDRLCDPVCGTGGILLEACLMGVDCVGGDADAGMIEGCRENLAAFGCSAELYGSRLQELPGKVGSVDAVVADLPYGRASMKQGEAVVERFLDAADLMTDGRVVFMLDRPSVAGVEHDFELYVHRSLSRYVFCCDAGDW